MELRPPKLALPDGGRPPTKSERLALVVAALAAALLGAGSAASLNWSDNAMPAILLGVAAFFAVPVVVPTVVDRDWETFRFHAEGHFVLAAVLAYLAAFFLSILTIGPRR